MSSIGPQLPPHLSKRKRTSEDESGNSPPTKQSRNTDEIDLEDDSDDGYGPTAPSGPSKKPEPVSKPSIGPTLPPPNPTNTNEIPLGDSDSDDGYGPSGPRAAHTAHAAGALEPRSSIGPALKSRQPIGPTLPPVDHQADDGNLSDSDDDYGPALPSSTTSAQRAQAAAVAAAAAASAGPVAPQRDDWMLAPPTDSGYRERDPTRLKNRKFTSGKSSSAAAGGGGISSIWTETPEQKRKRLEDAVLGRGDSGAGVEQQKPRRTRDDEERDRRISENIAASRGRSMYEEHQENQKRDAKTGKKGEEEDDPSKRAFDKEKDMSLGGKIGTAQRRELLNHAKDFGGRFQKGSYL